MIYKIFKLAGDKRLWISVNWILSRFLIKERGDNYGETFTLNCSIDNLAEA